MVFFSDQCAPVYSLRRTGEELSVWHHLSRNPGCDMRRRTTESGNIVTALSTKVSQLITRRVLVSSNKNMSYLNDTATSSEDLPLFRMKTIKQVNRFICVILGIPLNLLVAVVILRSKQLWSPRNIFWLAVTFFNLLALTQAIIELCIYYLFQRRDGSHETLCQVYSTIVGSPYVLLLTGLMLATWDRYLALSRHQFYKRYASPRNVSLILLAVFCIIAGKKCLI